jgi:hypothetical protein
MNRVVVDPFYAATEPPYTTSLDVTRESARRQVRDLISSRLAGLVREADGLETPDDVARRYGLGLGTVRNLLNGDSDPHLSTALVLVQGLGLRSIENCWPPSELAWRSARCAIEVGSADAWCPLGNLPDRRVSARRRWPIVGVKLPVLGHGAGRIRP